PTSEQTKLTHRTVIKTTKTTSKPSTRTQNQKTTKSQPDPTPTRETSYPQTLRPKTTQIKHSITTITRQKPITSQIQKTPSTTDHR
ncbi:hypothetical protein AAHH78_35450, partial [Burkholderia pseudomallei]